VGQPNFQNDEKPPEGHTRAQLAATFAHLTAGSQSSHIDFHLLRAEEQKVEPKTMENSQAEWNELACRDLSSGERARQAKRTSKVDEQSGFQLGRNAQDCAKFASAARNSDSWPLGA